MLENRPPAQDAAVPLSKPNPLQTLLTDFHEDDCIVSTSSNQSDSYTIPLTAESTTFSESDMSMLNKSTGATSINPVPLAGVDSREMLGTEAITEIMQAEL
ncbi:hypothetical protein N7509_000847 [Penicillium cosmopolitanum]|uniref:Uncharacterized protein n=1 Tax=Penicillium cosmopolitanum TaxID=1131564 RepID=A0A9W9WB17_9EURO|nr:uncharacterized protein N7509_000847 [Penicillium cosmopolitanum]KAJ5414220.1 hypothetical protein N7509_000847 [Penicillium cosmopolitanum]